MSETQERKSQQLQRLDEARFAGRAERAERTRVHQVIPNDFFSAASSECQAVFIDGHYYACISLAQAVAEGLARFLGDLRKIGARKNPQQRVCKLSASGFITDLARDAFLRIWSYDRNAFHHINRDIPTNPAELERRAEDCVNALFEIESEVFAFTFLGGKLVPKQPAYWPESDPEHLEVFLRFRA